MFHNKESICVVPPLKNLQHGMKRKRNALLFAQSHFLLLGDYTGVLYCLVGRLQICPGKEAQWA